MFHKYLNKIVILTFEPYEAAPDVEVNTITGLAERYLNTIVILSFHPNDPPFIYPKVGARFHKFLNTIPILVFDLDEVFCIHPFLPADSSLLVVT